MLGNLKLHFDKDVKERISFKVQLNVSITIIFVITFFSFEFEADKLLFPSTETVRREKKCFKGKLSSHNCSMIT